MEHGDVKLEGFVYFVKCLPVLTRQPEGYRLKVLCFAYFRGFNLAFSNDFGESVEINGLIGTTGAAGDLPEDDDVVALETSHGVVRHDAVGTEEADAVKTLGHGARILGVAAGARVVLIHEGVGIREYGWG